MKIAIVSDTHDNWSNIKKALDYIKSQDVKVLILRARQKRRLVVK